MKPDVKLSVVTVPVIDTGIGRRAGYANDAELIAAQRAEVSDLLSPEAMGRIDEAEAELTRRLLGG